METTKTAPDLNALLPQEALDQVLDELRRIGQRQQELLLPIQMIEGGLKDPHCLYSPEIHADLCRKKLMGLSDASAAKAVGIHPATLGKWRRTFPKLRYDMDEAAGLANTQAAAILQILMLQATGPTAFHAVKLFLETHLPEFRQTTKLEVEHSLKGVARQIRDMYGVGGNTLGGNGHVESDAESESEEENDGDTAEEEEASTEAELDSLPSLDALLLPPPPPAPAPPQPETKPRTRPTWSRKRRTKPARRPRKKSRKPKTPSAAVEVLKWL